MQSEASCRLSEPRSIPTLLWGQSPTQPQLPPVTSTAQMPFAAWCPSPTIDVWSAFQQQLNQYSTLTRSLVKCTDKLHAANTELVKIVESQNEIINSQQDTIKMWRHIMVDQEDANKILARTMARYRSEAQKWLRKASNLIGNTNLYFQSRTRLEVKKSYHREYKRSRSRSRSRERETGFKDTSRPRDSKRARVERESSLGESRVERESDLGSPRSEPTGRLPIGGETPNPFGPKGVECAEEGEIPSSNNPSITKNCYK
jgi:hypothetical protein